MIFISHLQTLQILNKAKFHAFFEKFRHSKLKPAPTQDKFLDIFQNEFSPSNVSKKLFFTWMGGKRFALARARMGMNPHSSEKKFFGNILSVKIHFVKGQGIYLESGLVSAFNGWTSQKNAWNFDLFEIWSGCRCDMKIIFGVFDNLDAKLLSNKIFWCWHAWSFDSGNVYFISECQGYV